MESVIISGKGSKDVPSEEESLPPSTGITPGMLSPIHSPLPHTPEPRSPRPHSPTPPSQRGRGTRLAALPRLNPMVESTGVMTKHTIIQDQGKIPFELKLNITDSELVVVENTSLWDTNAVILKVCEYWYERDLPWRDFFTCRILCGEREHDFLMISGQVGSPSLAKNLMLYIIKFIIQSIY